MNKTMIIGHIGADAEIKERNDKSSKFIVFSLAHSEKYGDKDITTWYKVYIQHAKTVEGQLVNFLKKGTKVLVEARQSARHWVKEDGTVMIDYVLNVFPMGIELLSSSQGTGANQPPDPLYQGTAQSVSSEPLEVNKNDDDLPF